MMSAALSSRSWLTIATAPTSKRKAEAGRTGRSSDEESRRNYIPWFSFSAGHSDYRNGGEARIPMKMAVIDWETSGLPLHPSAELVKQPRAIEFGGVVVDENGNELDELEFMCNPGFAIEEIITKITGITRGDLYDKPRIGEHLPRLRKFFEGVDVLCAHNLPFDSTIMWIELRHAGIKDWPWPRYNICTAQLYTELYGYRPKLQELYFDVIGKEFAQEHRALSDVRALAEVVLEENLLDMFASIPPTEGENRIYQPPHIRQTSEGRRTA
jgi:DNA polymerase III epsilon subunit-like protein